MITELAISARCIITTTECDKKLAERELKILLIDTISIPFRFDSHGQVDDEKNLSLRHGRRCQASAAVSVFLFSHDNLKFSPLMTSENYSRSDGQLHCDTQLD